MDRFLRGIAVACVTLGLAACAPPREPAPPSVASDGGKRLTLPESAALPPGPLQCVPYARLASGIQIRGDAWTWWNGAAGRFDRGQRPQVGAVLVFKRNERLSRGHVSVVAEVVGSREILVTHANWGSTAATRGKVMHDVRVADVSPANDWSRVRVWNGATGAFGRVYPAYGFVYPSAVAQPAALSALPAPTSPPGG
jgi:surface antigen